MLGQRPWVCRLKSIIGLIHFDTEQKKLYLVTKLVIEIPIKGPYLLETVSFRTVRRLHYTVSLKSLQ